jgi:hypothetical protein
MSSNHAAKAAIEMSRDPADGTDGMGPGQLLG